MMQLTFSYTSVKSFVVLSPGLHDYIEQKSTEVRQSEGLLRGATVLNHRQQALIAHALRHPARYSIEGHRRSHDIVYETARNDLMVLAEMNLMERRKVGRAFGFLAPPDLAERLQGFSIRR